MTIVSFDEIISRAFTDWSMSLCSLDYDNLNEIFKHSCYMTEFNPTHMRPEALVLLTQELSKMSYGGRILQM